MKRAMSTLLFAAIGLSMSGCTAPAPSSTPMSSAPPVTSDQDLYGYAELWISPTGDVSLCPPQLIDLGFGGPEVCADPLTVSGIDAAAVVAEGPVGFRLDVDGPAEIETGIPTIRPEEPGWAWTQRIFSGRIDGDHFSVTAVDDPEAVAAATAALPVLRNPEGFATVEEKLAAQYALGDPAGYDCPEPPGGWRAVWWDDSAVDRYRATHPDGVVGWTLAPLSDDVTIALFGADANADLDAVRADMDLLFPGAACVIPSAVRESDIHRALADPALGDGLSVDRARSDDDGRSRPLPTISIRRPAITPDLAAALQSYPAGLIQTETWLHPLPSRAETTPAAQPPLPLDDTNIELIRSLDAEASCLLRDGVFPAGGVGYADSSLPYDGYAPLDRALASYSAELLRAYPDQLSGIRPGLSADGRTPVAVDVSIQKGAALEALMPSLDEWGSPALVQASADLASAGIPVHITAEGVSNLLESCAVQDAITDGAVLAPLAVSVVTGTEPDSGRLAVTVPERAADEARALLSGYGDAVVVYGSSGSIDFQ